MRGTNLFIMDRDAIEVTSAVLLGASQIRSTLQNRFLFSLLWRWKATLAFSTSIGLFVYLIDGYLLVTGISLASPKQVFVEELNLSLNYTWHIVSFWVHSSSFPCEVSLHTLPACYMSHLWPKPVVFKLGYPWGYLHQFYGVCRINLWMDSKLSPVLR